MVKNIAKSEVGQLVFPMFAESEAAALNSKTVAVFLKESAA